MFRKKLDNWKIVQLSGRLKKDDLLPVRELCRQIIENGKPFLALNMSRVQFIDSTGLGIIIHCYNRIRSASGEFILINPNDHIMNIIEMLSLNKFFTIVDSQKDLSKLSLSFSSN
jgi:anti-sigma B factor antagonist